jgi:hypothetical protein
MTKRSKWTREEAGWYTHPSHGGVIQGCDNKWYHTPIKGQDRGPYKTAKAAMKSTAKKRTTK